MLTPVHSRVLRAIQDAVDQSRSTSCREIMRRTGYASPSSIHKAVQGLRERGFLSASSRPLVVVRRIEDVTSGTPLGADDPVVAMIHAYQTAHDGTSPTVREIAAALGITSLSSAHRLIAKTERRGYISHLCTRKSDRAIRVVKREEDGSAS